MENTDETQAAALTTGAAGEWTVRVDGSGRAPLAPLYMGPFSVLER